MQKRDMCTLNKVCKKLTKYLKERYRLLYEEIEEKHKLKMKMIDDHYNEIVVKNERLLMSFQSQTLERDKMVKEVYNTK